MEKIMRNKIGFSLIHGLIAGSMFSCGALLADEVNAEKIADTFYKLNYNPKTPHMKINHTKGFCSIGQFKPNSKVLERLNIKLLSQKEIPALVRYSLGGAEMDDRSKGRGMVVRLQGKDGATWTMVMLNSEINFARTPEEFLKFFEMKIPVNGKVDMQKIKEITESTPSFKNFNAYMKNVGVSKSVANTAYYSVHTFWFEGKDGKQIAARWKFVPTDGVKYLSDSEVKKQSKDFLESEFKARVAKKPIGYKMYLVLANPNDPTNDTTALWSGKHQEILVGDLSVDSYDGLSCNGDVFFPNDLPSGINPPKDPIFELRNETYGVTFGRRQ